MYVSSYGMYFVDKNTHNFNVIYNFQLTSVYIRVQVINCYYETWILGPFSCELYALLGSLFGCGSIWTMTMISFDRYNVIVKGLSAKPMTIGGVLIRILGIWLFSLIWTVAPLFGWNR